MACHNIRGSIDEGIQKFLKESSDEESEGTAFIKTEHTDSDFSDGEDENIMQSDHDSDTTMQCDSSDDDDAERFTQFQNIDDYFMGRDDITKWMKTETVSATYMNTRKIYNIFPEPKGEAKELHMEVKSFNQIVNTNMIDEIVNHTNSFITRKRSDNTYSRARDANLTSRAEICALIGLLYLIGLKGGRKATVKELWVKDGTGMALLRACMSYKRFLFLLSCLRFDNKETRPERLEIDKLAAIRSFLDSFVLNCKENYDLGEFVAIDEILKPFRGRCSFIRYIPYKEAKYGIKIYALCDVQTLYTGNLEIHCGRQPDGPYAASIEAKDIVQRLIQPIQGENRNLTTDNWYTSYSLAAELLQKQVTCIGNLRKNEKEIPLEFLPARNRVPGSFLFGYRTDCTLVSYVPKQNTAVLVLSSRHCVGKIEEKSGKPEIILDYNKTKDAVADVDRMCSKYTVARTSRRWTMALWYVLLNIAGINARILFHANPENEKFPRRVFLKHLSLQLVKGHLNERAKIDSLPMDIRGFLSAYKIKETVTVPVEYPRKRRGRCTLCGRAKNVHSTKKCSRCGEFTCPKHIKKITIVCEECDEEEQISESD